MPSTGRPRALNDDKRRDICALVAAGVGLDAAARYAGCSVYTIRREAVRNEPFAKDLRASEARAQLDPLQSMRDAARSHWRAAAWLLERANPRQFGRNRQSGCSPQELHDVVDAIVRQAVEEIADANERDRVCRQLLAAAYRASRALAAEHHARLNPPSSALGPPLNPGASNIEALLAEIHSLAPPCAAPAVQYKQNSASPRVVA